MRKLFPIIAIGLVALTVIGMIAGGVTLLIYGAKPYFEKLSTKKTEQPPAADAPQHQRPPGQVPVPGGLNFVKNNMPEETMNLLEARAKFQPELVVRGVQGEQQSLPIAGPDVKIVQYGPNKLSGVLFEPKMKGAHKYPVVVWAHSGTAGVSEDLWKSLAPFREAGFVVMCPAFRGEQGNLGQLELFYGEVDDLLAAVNYVREKPEVDQNRIYVFGERGGGTLALLAATTGTTEVRAFLAISPIADMEEYARQKLTKNDAPFDVTNHDEVRLRSPILFTKFITRPTFIFNSINPAMLDEQSKRMASIADKENLQKFQAFSIPRASRDDLSKLIPLFVKQLLSDKGPRCTIDFNIKDLTKQVEK